MVDVGSEFTIPSSAPRRSAIDIARTVHAAVWAPLEKRWVYRRTLWELQTCSRRTLLDMGIDPDGLDGLARQAAGL